LAIGESEYSNQIKKWNKECGKKVSTI